MGIEARLFNKQKLLLKCLLLLKNVSKQKELVIIQALLKGERGAKLDQRRHIFLNLRHNLVTPFKRQKNLIPFDNNSTNYTQWFSFLALISAK